MPLYTSFKKHHRANGAFVKTMVKLPYSFFVIGGENTMTVEQRIQAVIELLPQNDCIELEDGKLCHNEQELRNALMEKGGIL